MGKRKSAPQRIDENKRKCLSWNMQDLGSDLHIIQDNDSQLQQEHQTVPHSSVVDKTFQVDPGPSSHYEEPSSSSHYDSSLTHYPVQDLIDQTDFTVSIYDRLHKKEFDWAGLLVTFRLKLGSNDPSGKLKKGLPLPQVSEFWLYVNLDSEHHLLYFEFPEDKTGIACKKKSKPEIAYCYAMVEGITAECLEASQLKAFPLVLSSYNPDIQEAEVNLFILESGLGKIQFASEGARPTKTNQALQKVLAMEYGLTLPAIEKQSFNKRHDIESLYEEVKLRHKSMSRDIVLNVQHPCLKPQLRNYQKQAVFWMLQQERYGCEDRDHQAFMLMGQCRATIQLKRLSRNEDKGKHPTEIIGENSMETMGSSRLHCLFEEFRSLDNQKLFYNRHGGYLVRDMPCFLNSPPGGILADEMGLGKTVEVLACMLLHPRTDLPPITPLPVTLPPQPSLLNMKAEPTLKTEMGENSSKAVPNESTTFYSNEDKSNQTLVQNDEKNQADHPNHSCANIKDIGSSDSQSEKPGHISETENCTVMDLENNQDRVSSEEMNNTVNDAECESSMLPKDNVEVGESIGLTNESGYVNSNISRDEIGMNAHQESLNTSDDKLLGDQLDVTPVFPVTITPLANCKVSAALQDHDYCMETACDKIAPDVVMLDSSNLTLVEEVVVATPHEMPSRGNDSLSQSTELSTPSTSEKGRKKKNTKRATNKSKKAEETDLSSDIKSGESTKPKVKRKQNRKNKAVNGGTEDSVLPTEKDLETKKRSHAKGKRKSQSKALESNSGSNDKKESKPKKGASNKSKKKSDKSEASSPENEAPGLAGSTEITGMKADGAVAKKPRAKRKSWKKKHTFVQFIEVKDEDEQNNVITKHKTDQQEFFECVCGAKGILLDDKERVKCEKCHLWQHPCCVHYDLADPYRGRYLCPHCHVAEVPIPSGATLIITPSSISHQWVEEIQKHIHKERLKVLVYTGVHKQGFIQPQTLANHHIVITSYETLRKEIDYVDLPHSNSDEGRRFRHPKRFMAIPSPITAVEWWRVCLDEAQMVECTTTKTAEMALRLTAVNRWCVTGTPIQRGIDDLYGLFLFLGVDPFWVQHWWNRLLYLPYCHGNQDPLHNVLSGVLWRTAKKDVIDQICLPAQADAMHWLTFSPVEEHFYRRTYQHCLREAMQTLSKWTNNEMKLNSLDRYTLHSLLAPLTKLRQACCHPQAVRGEFMPIHKSTMTMEELLLSLTKKVRLECEEAHRQCVFAMNGLAALDIIEQKYPDAVEKYREVLRSVVEQKAEVRTDPLQQLHTIHNLAEILTLKPDGVSPTLRDDLLIEQAKDIREQYLTKAGAFVTQAEEAWGPVKKSLRDLQHQMHAGRHWWVEVIKWAMQGAMEEYLVERIKDDLAENASPDMQRFASSFRDLRGLQYMLFTHLEKLHTSHASLVKELNRLSGRPSQDLINQTVECCLRPADQILKTCPFCKVDKMFEDYESTLFSFIDKGVSDPLQGEDSSGGFQISTRRQGNWADSEAEKTLKILLSFFRSTRGPPAVAEQGTVHMKVLEALKKEFRCLRTMFMALKENVAAFDELDMATTRIRLRLPEEPRTDPPQSNIIEPAEKDAQKLKFASDKIVGQNLLKKKMGQLLYLKNLAKAQHGLSGGHNPEPCPICQRELGNKWSVLRCGHCYCLECIRIMVDRCSFGGRNRSMRCAICRQSTLHADISYVCTRGGNLDEEQSVQVKGDHSTKIEGIIRCLLEIIHQDSKAKALVFSTWSDVLDILSQALMENNISFKSLHAQNKFQTNLQEFRHKGDIKVLLLPVHSGSNGLNLIEATHVLLVEPILNPAQELQAIGRIHRIGQTKTTTVHRFIVRGTIEERMYTLLRTVQTPVNSHNAEETNMTIGEFSSLFEDMPQEDEEDENLGTDDVEGQNVPVSGGSASQTVGDDVPMVTTNSSTVVDEQGNNLNKQGNNLNRDVTEETFGETCEGAQKNPVGLNETSCDDAQPGSSSQVMLSGAKAEKAVKVNSVGEHSGESSPAEDLVHECVRPLLEAACCSEVVNEGNINGHFIGNAAGDEVEINNAATNYRVDVNGKVDDTVHITDNSVDEKRNVSCAGEEEK